MALLFFPNQMHDVSFNKQEPNWCIVNKGMNACFVVQICRKFTKITQSIKNVTN